jgi:hypothetical protein
MNSILCGYSLNRLQCCFTLKPPHIYLVTFFTNSFFKTKRILEQKIGQIEKYYISILKKTKIFGLHIHVIFFRVFHQWT